MKVIVNFGEKKVVVPCGTNGDLLIRELIQLATAKYRKLSLYNDLSGLNSDQIQLRLNNGAVVDPDDRVCDVADDREELFTMIDSSPKNLNSNGELSSSLTSSNLSTSLSDQDRPGVPPPAQPKPSINHRHEVIVTDADLRTRSLRIKTESTNPHVDKNEMYNVHFDDKTGDQIFTILLPKENSPLGIHVIPYNSNENQVDGLVLQNVENDGRIKRQGILQINDRIIEINRINIEQCSFEKAQLIFRNALLESELELRIVRSFKKPSIPVSNSNEFNQTSKRLGKVIKITLVKGIDGLGFKLASRDNPTGVANPIYVKTIFPKGAAIEDGRLQNGDRLLMVNSIDVTQMSLQETVSLLRETRIGDTVHLCVSRQQDGSLPKDLIIDEVKTQIMTFDIPLRDTSSAGLGITLKGKTSIIDGQSTDLGIFVKSILTGGAAYRDNRLRPNDQILVINDSSLVNLTNLEAANILHDAVRKEIQPGFIKITITRNEQNQNSKNVKETEISPLTNNEENELDLTNFVPSTNNRKTPINEFDIRSQTPSRMKATLSEKQNQEEIHSRTPNPFDRETPFRQSISEKRRLNQQSFHETRTNSERRHPPTRMRPNSSTNMVRSSSYESITTRPTKENDEQQKRQIKSRHRACNDSFRQAVDRSYNKNNYTETINGERPNKVEKTRFKFSNLFTNKSKKKENQEEKSSPLSIKSIVTPPPPSPFSSYPDFIVPKSQHFQTEHKLPNLPDCQPLSYQPYRFESPNRPSSTVHHMKSSHPPIPQQFLQSNITGTQSLKQHQPATRSTYPTNYFLSSNQRTTSTNSYLQLENPANV